MSVNLALLDFVETKNRLEQGQAMEGCPAAGTATTCKENLIFTLRSLSLPPPSPNIAFFLYFSVVAAVLHLIRLRRREWPQTDAQITPPRSRFQCGAGCGGAARLQTRGKQLEPRRRGRRSKHGEGTERAVAI